MHRELLDQRRVPGFVARPQDDVAPGISKRSRLDRGIIKGAGIKQRAGNTGMRIWILDNVGACGVPSHRTAAIGAAGVVGIAHGIPIARGGGKYARQLPVSDELVQNTGSALAEEFPTTKRQIVHIAQNKAVANVEVGVGILQIGVRLIAEISVVRRAHTGAGSVVKGVGVSVSGLELQPMAEALFQTGLQRIVVGSSVGAQRVNRGIQRRIAVRAWIIGWQSQTASATRAAGPIIVVRGAACSSSIRLKIGIKDGLVTVVEPIEFRSVRAAISDFENSLGGKLVLEPKMPLLGVGSGQVRVYRIKGRRIGILQRAHKGAAEHIVLTEIRIAIVNRAACRRRATSRGKRLRGKEWGIESRTGVGEGAAFLAAVEDAVAAAQYQLVGQLVGEANAGRDIT